MSRSETTSPLLAPLLESFFCNRLIQQRDTSPRTVASYRDSFRLLLHYLQEQHRKKPSVLTIAELDAPCVLAFLDYLEAVRNNTARTRNLRLAAIRSFLEYAAWCDPLILPIAQRVRAIPIKRFERPLIQSLSRDEVLTLLDAPNSDTKSGQRDRVMFTLMYNTGARVSEVTAWRVNDPLLNDSPAIRIHGKGRKERSAPLWKSTARLLRRWLKQIDVCPDMPLLPNARGCRLTRSGIEHRLHLAVRMAVTICPSLAGRRISPHTLRHTTAMHLLQSGVEMSVIALWLGHEDLNTTHQYIEADLVMKRQALEHLDDPSLRPHRYIPEDHLLHFLDRL